MTATAKPTTFPREIRFREDILEPKHTHTHSNNPPFSAGMYARDRCYHFVRQHRSLCKRVLSPQQARVPRRNENSFGPTWKSAPNILHSSDSECVALFFWEMSAFFRRMIAQAVAERSKRKSSWFSSFVEVRMKRQRYLYVCTFDVAFDYHYKSSTGKFDSKSWRWPVSPKFSDTFLIIISRYNKGNMIDKEYMNNRNDKQASENSSLCTNWK